MRKSRAQRDISVSKQRPTPSRSVGPSISDAVAAQKVLNRFGSRGSVVLLAKSVNLTLSCNGAAGSCGSWRDELAVSKACPQHLSERNSLAPKRFRVVPLADPVRRSKKNSLATQDHSSYPAQKQP